MKKLLSMVLALMSVTAIFTSCGTDEPESSANLTNIGNSTSDSSQADESSETEETVTEAEETTTEAETTTEETPETTTEAAQNEAVSGDAEYIAAIDRLCDAVKASDNDEVIRSILPKSTYEAAKNIGFSDFASELGLLEENSTYESIEVISVESVSAEDIKVIEQTLSMYELLFQTMGDMDITFDMMMNYDEDDADDEYIKKMEEFDDIIDDYEDDFDDGNIESIVDIESYDIVTLDVDGETTEMYFFKCRGDEMKVDIIFAPAMIGYVHKSKLASANSTASTIYKAASSAITELDEEGVDLDGVHIICSDSSKNVVGGEMADNLDLFYEKLKNFFNDADKVDYFVVVSDGYCYYSAICQNEYIGTYPIHSVVDKLNDDTVLTSDYSYELENQEFTFDDLYQFAVDAVS